MPQITPYNAPTAKPKVSSTTTAVALPSTAGFEVWVTAASGNTASVYLGDSSVTSAAGGNVFTELVPGAIAIISIADASKLYHVAASGTQTLYVGALR